ncbi:MAG: DUF3108 domain-containing protein [Betaproteobacteria bacterium]
MPVALIIALAASLGIHLSVLFGPEMGGSTEPEAPTLLAELRPLPKALAEPVHKPVKPKVRKTLPHQVVETLASATPAISVPGASPEGVPEALATGEVVVADEPPTIVASRLPEHGRILYRVDRGDSGFEIGKATSEWAINDGHYRLNLETETTGLVWLFKSYRISMESQGRLDAEGLKPDHFAIRRNGIDAGENASFDWDNMQIRLGDGAAQEMAAGAQDLLSFNFHLGFMPHSVVGNTLPITTGKKYGIYRLEVLGDEEVDTPAGLMRTLHLRAPGTNTTELWLAYDYLLLPVKIRHTDAKGDSLVQIALHIQLSPE